MGHESTDASVRDWDIPFRNNNSLSHARHASRHDVVIAVLSTTRPDPGSPLDAVVHTARSCISPSLPAWLGRIGRQRYSAIDSRHASGGANRVETCRAAEDLDPVISRQRISAILEEESRIWPDRSHLLIKYPHLSRYVSLVRSASPNCKFIHIIRDGRAVALSLRAERLRSTYPDASDAEKQQLIENIAKYWVDVLNEIEAEKESTDIFELRYEDFCTDVRGALRSILRHVGLADSLSICALSRGSHANGRHVDRRCLSRHYRRH